MSNRSPGVYWQVRLPDLWSDPGLPVDFSSSFPTQMQTIPWSEPWFIHVFLPIGPSQYFPTKIQHPCPHLFFLPRPAKCKSHKFTRNIQKQSPKHPKASPKYPPKNLRTSKSQIFGLQVFLLQFPGFSRSKNRKHLSPLFFPSSLRQEPKNYRHWPKARRRSPRSWVPVERWRFWVEDGHGT